MTLFRRSLGVVLWCLCLVLAFPCVAAALEPSEVLVVANRNAAEGVELARHYTRTRQIPDANLLFLTVPTAEICGRKVYEKRIAAPVRDYLAAVTPSWRIRCLVLMYGMPLKVRPSEKQEAETVRDLKTRRDALQQRVEKENGKGDHRVRSALADELESVRSQLKRLKVTSDRWASVDSELSVVRAIDAPVGGWIENPYYIGFADRAEAIARKDVLMVSRLDGPTPADVRRIIDDTVYAEQAGLSGTAYFDARWPMRHTPPQGGYQLYDRSIHRAAQMVEKSGVMPVVVNDAAALFEPGACPDAALYCGWYSLATYVDAFEWQRGAIGYHIASNECTTLKKKESRVWCKRMIEQGVCATVGPVGEPYIQAFPMPELFFELLTEGTLSLGECYLASLPFLSWKMVLIGDPLYRPFANARPRDPADDDR
jgi:uncharacterized protein (TIGR03790 family)